MNNKFSNETIKHKIFFFYFEKNANYMVYVFKLIYKDANYCLLSR